MTGSDVKMNKGFTLVEMLVVALIFSIVIGAATSVFANTLKLQRYNLNQQQLVNQTSYAMDYMSRALRMARGNYTVNGSSIQFQTYHGQTWRFYLGSDTLKINQDGVIYDLTSNDFKVNSFNVSVSGVQPMVTIDLEIEGKVLGNDKPKIRIQTAVSRRQIIIP